MSHTTYVQHTGYQVNIIHHEIMFQVTINNIVQYICQCRIRPPNRAGGNATRHGTDANSGDGWVGSLVVGDTLGAGPKVRSSIRRSNRLFEHRCRPAPYRAYRYNGRDPSNSDSARAPSLRAISVSTPFRCRSQTQPRSEAVAGRSYRIESVLRGLPPSAPTSNPTGFRLVILPDAEHRHYMYMYDYV